MKRLTDKQGFTLIEIIVVLVIMGIMAVGLNSAITYGVQHFVFARNADQLSQKAQLAMARLSRELIDIKAVDSASADQVDFRLPKSKAPTTVPPCNLDECNYRIKRNGTQITLEGTSPVVTAQVLIDGLNATNNSKDFLSYFQSNGTAAWTTANGFGYIKADGSINANYLATIKVQIALDFPSGGNPLEYQGTVNPRANGILNAPKLN